MNAEQETERAIAFIDGALQAARDKMYTGNYNAIKGRFKVIVKTATLNRILGVPISTSVKASIIKQYQEAGWKVEVATENSPFALGGDGRIVGDIIIKYKF